MQRAGAVAGPSSPVQSPEESINMIRPLGTAIVGLALLFATQTARGGLLILSGDTTPVFSLTNTAPNAQVPGNRNFFVNILRGDTQVAVLESGPNLFDHTELDEYYNSLAGVTSIVFWSGTVTIEGKRCGR
jgi:hypothetical protein